MSRSWWHGAMCIYGLLSLSSMAGMGLGSALFLLTTFYFLWKEPHLRVELWELMRSPLGLASLGLFGAAVLSLLAAAIWPPAGMSVAGFSELKKFHYFFTPFFVALPFLAFPKGIEKHPFWRCWVGMGVFSALVAALQFFAADLLPQAWLGQRFFRAVGGTNRFHGQGLMFFHLSFASCLSFVAAAGIARFLWPRNSDALRTRLAWLAAGCAGALAVFYSYSRISWLALAVMLVTLTFFKRWRYGVAAIFVVIAAAALLWTQSESVRARIELARAGNQERYALWYGAWEALKDRPLSGVGFGRTGHYAEHYATIAIGKKPDFTSHAHNNILDTLAAMGVMGFFAFLAWWLVVFGMAWKAFRAAPEEERWLGAAAMAALLSFHVNGLTQVNFWDGKSQHTLMIWVGIALALWARNQRLRAS